jgi:hypothetical protein
VVGVVSEVSNGADPDIQNTQQQATLVRDRLMHLIALFTAVVLLRHPKIGAADKEAMSLRDGMKRALVVVEELLPALEGVEGLPCVDLLEEMRTMVVSFAPKCPALWKASGPAADQEDAGLGAAAAGEPKPGPCKVGDKKRQSDEAKAAAPQKKRGRPAIQQVGLR